MSADPGCQQGSQPIDSCMQLSLRGRLTCNPAAAGSTLLLGTQSLQHARQYILMTCLGKLPYMAASSDDFHTVYSMWSVQVARRASGAVCQEEDCAG